MLLHATHDDFAIEGGFTIQNIDANVKHSVFTHVQRAFMQAVGGSVERASLELSHANVLKPWSKRNAGEMPSEKQQWSVRYFISVQSRQKAHIMSSFVKTSAFLKIFLSEVHKLDGFKHATI